MRLAVYQGTGYLGEIEKNLELLAHKAEAAAAQAADFLVLPELFLTGYGLGDAIQTLAQSWESPALQQMEQIAQTHRLALLVGYPEAAEGMIYNSAVLINAAGQVVGNYRKTHLFGEEERRLFQPGHQWLVQEIAGMRVGVLICFDVEFPEAARSLADQGVELIAVPTANMEPYVHIPDLLVPARAAENQVFVAYANKIGTEGNLTFCGGSCIAAPNGKLLAQAALNEALLIADLSQEAIAQARTAYCYLQERRLDLYKTSP